MKVFVAAIGVVLLAAIAVEFLARVDVGPVAASREDGAGAAAVAAALVGADAAADAGRRAVGAIAHDSLAARTAPGLDLGAGEDDGHARSLTVEVVDASGAVLEGVHVGLVDVLDFVPWTVTSAVTDARGRARLSYAAELEVGPDKRFEVAALGPFTRAHASRVVLDPPPTEPVRVVLPARSVLEVAVEDAEGRAVGGTDVAVALAGALHNSYVGLFDRGQLAATGRTSGAGIVRFEHVEASADVVVAARETIGTGELIVRATAAPAGGVVRVDLAFSPDDCVLSGRLDLGADAVTDGWTCVVMPMGERVGRISAHRMRIDDDGRFRLRIPPARLATASASAWASIQHSGVPRASVSLHGRLAGAHDVGVLDAGPPPVLVAGRALRSDGTPVAGHPLGLEVRGAPDGVWHPLPWVQTESAEDGAFEFGARAPDALEWNVKSLEGEARVAPAAMHAGAAAERLVLRPLDCVVRGRVRVDPELLDGLGDLLELRVIHPEDPEWEDWIELEDDGTFAIEAEQGATFVLVVRFPWTEQPLARLDVLAPERGVEATPLSIDLRDRLRANVVSGFDLDGRPIVARLYDARSALGTPHGQPERRIRVLYGREPLELVARAAGRREEPVRLDGADVEVRFTRRALSVRLSWPERPEPSPRLALRPHLVPLERWDGAPWMHHDARNRALFDARGEAMVDVERPGRFAVLLGAEWGGDVGRSCLMLEEPTPFEPPWIDVQDVDAVQSFRVAWDDAAVAAFATRIAR